jgi:hypothetical protein
MTLSRILGADMALLFSFRFLINETRAIKAAGLFYKFFIDNCVFLVFWGQVITTLRTVGVCGYLHQGCLLRRFPTLGYCSITMNGLGGELNDINK